MFIILILFTFFSLFSAMPFSVSVYYSHLPHVSFSVCSFYPLLVNFCYYLFTILTQIIILFLLIILLFFSAPAPNLIRWIFLFLLLCLFDFLLVMLFFSICVYYFDSFNIFVLLFLPCFFFL